jgi:RNA polymerase sigma factor (sigma-70 family)
VVSATAEERPTETDAWAIEKSLADPAAFVSVFERHFALLHRYLQVRAGESSADDLAAQTFEIAFRRRADYDTKRSDARPWLFGIALNLLRDARRHERRQQHALERIGPLEADYDSSLEQVDARAGAGAVRRALAEVPEEDRDLLLLHACADLSYDECALALGVPVGTVRSRLHRLRARLRKRLEPELGWEDGA